ncbi:F-box/FBD/LRR-repeat protein At1g13570-like isoform X2 [Rutidosis leptorrhynchoides]|uniref:F-box/FBD/LRR-repeat protein At1g13570-like isoform X2 n=1 Tax=Rutidosis leptorrhynchoides TaxID=125765 RepID=UPI003A98CF88
MITWFKRLNVTFSGFTKLKNLVFEDVRISNKVLQHLLSNCPLLETISLIEYDDINEEHLSFDFVKLFQCVPLIYALDISMYCMKYEVSGGMPPHKLPTSLNLKYVRLDVCLREEDAVSSALCIIRSSPNLEQLSFAMYDYEGLAIQESSINFEDLHDGLEFDLRSS